MTGAVIRMMLSTQLLLFLVLFVLTVSSSLGKKPKWSPSSSSCVGRANGLYPDPKSCRKFIHCHQSGRAASKHCPGKLLFNPAIKVCDWPSNVKCNKASSQKMKVPSEPRNLSATVLNSTIVRLGWAAPGLHSTRVLRYVIEYRRTHENASSNAMVTVQPQALSYNLTGLLPGSKYLIEIQAVNKAGKGRKARMNLITPLEVPAAPSNVTAKPLGSTAISMRWRDPDLLNDYILGYTITYGVHGLRSIGRKSLHLQGYANTAVLTHLLPGVEYEVKVQALSFGGFGKPSVVKVTTSSGDFCPRGQYSETGKKPCCECAYGRYQSRVGKKWCNKCPRGTITLKRGALSANDCQKITTD